MKQLIAIVASVASVLLPAGTPTQAPQPKRLLFLTHAGLYKHSASDPPRRPSSTGANRPGSTRRR